MLNRESSLFVFFLFVIFFLIDFIKIFHVLFLGVTCKFIIFVVLDSILNFELVFIVREEECNSTNTFLNVH